MRRPWIPWRAMRPLLGLALLLQLIALFGLRADSITRVHGGRIVPEWAGMVLQLWIFAGGYVALGYMTARWLQRHARAWHDVFPWGLPYLALFVAAQLLAWMLLAQLMPLPPMYPAVDLPNLAAEAAPARPDPEPVLVSVAEVVVAPLFLVAAVACGTILWTMLGAALAWLRGVVLRTSHTL